MIVERIKYLTDYCKGKSVLHCGAVDTVNCEEDFKKKRWLHAHLYDTCNVRGIDIAKDNRFFTEYDMTYCNLETDCKNISGKYDIVLMGEILEHLFNAKLVLENLKLFNGELIITTPNAYSIRLFLYALFNWEHINGTHTCYYSEKTLKYLLECSGYKITKIVPYAYMGTFGFIQKIFYYFFPKLTDGLIIHCDYSEI